MKTQRKIDSLCHGLPWQEWDAVLANGRHTTVSSNSWLETVVEEGETIALFLSGRVGLRPLREDVEGNETTIPYSAPAVLSLSEDLEHESAHWVLVQSTVCLFTSQKLQTAFAASPRFASNLVTVLQDQTKHHLRCSSKTEDGLGRLSASLLSRSKLSGEQKTRVKVTQSQLATETGLSRQWVNKLLKELEKRGFAERKRGHVVLLNPLGLEGLPAQR